MKKVMFKIMSICIVIIMLIPAAVGLDCSSNNKSSSDNESLAVILIDSFDDDGYLTFSVLNCCIVSIDNATILIRFGGSCPFINRNQVDIDTEIFVEHLPIGEKGLYKTKHQVFNVLPIIRRPLILFFGGFVDVKFNGYERDAIVMKIISLTRMNLIKIPYP